MNQQDLMRRLGNVLDQAEKHGVNEGEISMALAWYQGVSMARCKIAGQLPPDEMKKLLGAIMAMMDRAGALTFEQHEKLVVPN